MREVENQRAHGGYRKGRPARRYAFDPRVGVVVRDLPLYFDDARPRVPSRSSTRAPGISPAVIASRTDPTGCTIDYRTDQCAGAGDPTGVTRRDERSTYRPTCEYVV